MKRIDDVITWALYAALGLLGGLLALVGSFVFGRSLLAAVALCALNLAVFRAAGWATGTRAGAVVPALVWVTFAAVMSLPKSEGDLVVTGTLGGTVFLLGGMAAALAAFALTPATRSWLTGLPHDPRPRSR